MTFTAASIHLNSDKFEVNCGDAKSRHYVEIVQDIANFAIYGTPEQLQQIADAINIHLNGW